MTARAAVREVERELAAAGVPDPGTDAEILVSHVLTRPRSALYAVAAELTAAQRRRLADLVARRRGREPLQHVLGKWGFRRLTLGVDRRALVPRPETEVVVERCLELLHDLPEPCVLDVGTGTGAIALALADEHPGARVVAVEPDPDAISLAHENVARTGLGERVELVRGELFAGRDGPFDLVVSNPPYVPADELTGLEPEVRDHDPRGALLASGLTEAIAEGARRVLRPDGRVVLEVGDGQAPAVAGLLHSFGYADVTGTPDLTGRERVVDGAA